MLQLKVAIVYWGEGKGRREEEEGGGVCAEVERVERVERGGEGGEVD